MLYNVRIKTYPDGHKQYFWSENPFFRLDESVDSPVLVENIKRRRKLARLRRDIKSFDICDEDEFLNDDVVRLKWNMSQSINKVYDLARSNEFNWFITLTLSSEKVNRYDYDSCADAIKKFTDRLRKYGCKWLMVPEQHKDGAYHFHGLVAGDLPLTPSGKTCYNEVEQLTMPIYNLANYEFGFTTVTQVMKPDRTASYIAKYLTKKIAVPKGRKRYWASKSLARPTVEYLNTVHDTFVRDEETGEVRCIREYDGGWGFGVPGDMRYVKEINNEYGRFVISEE